MILASQIFMKDRGVDQDIIVNMSSRAVKREANDQVHTSLQLIGSRVVKDEPNINMIVKREENGLIIPQVHRQDNGVVRVVKDEPNIDTRIKREENGQITTQVRRQENGVFPGEMNIDMGIDSRDKGIRREENGQIITQAELNDNGVLQGEMNLDMGIDGRVVKDEPTIIDTREENGELIIHVQLNDNGVVQDELNIDIGIDSRFVKDEANIIDTREENGQIVIKVQLKDSGVVQGKTNSEESDDVNEELSMNIVSDQPEMMSFEERKEFILAQLPNEVKNEFRQLGFAKWRKDMCPVMFLGPYHVPPGKVRELWMRMFERVRRTTSS